MNDAMETERQPSNPGGILAPGSIEDLAGNQNPTAAAPAQPAQQPAPQNSGNVIGKTTAKVVDAEKATQDPNIVVVENKISGNDPLSVAISSYFSLRSKASTLGMKAAINQIKGVEGRNPTFDEFMKIMNDSRVKFAMLPPYQMYGYDAKLGGIVILQDNADKAERYKKAGIPLDN